MIDRPQKSDDDLNAGVKRARGAAIEAVRSALGRLRLVRRRAIAYARMAVRGLPGALWAALLVAATIAFDKAFAHILPPAPEDPAAPMTVLASIVTFFAVATLALSVSLSLLSTIKSESALVSILVDDRERDFLLQTILASFLVALAHLCLVAFGVIHPLAAVVLPALLAALTLVLMVGYILERVPLFDDRGLVEFLARRIASTLAVLESSAPTDIGDRLRLKREIGHDLIRIAMVVRRLVDGRRFDDAYEAMEIGLESFGNLIRIQTGPDPKVQSITKLPDRFRSADDEINALARRSGLVRQKGHETWDSGHPVEQSWWLVELAALPAFRHEVETAYRQRDNRLMELWLAWIDEMWVQRLMPSLPGRHLRSRDEHLDFQDYVLDQSIQAEYRADAVFAFRGAYLCLDQILRETLSVSQKEAEALQSPETRRRFGYLCGDLAAEVFDAGLDDLNEVGNVLVLLKGHVDRFNWSTNDPLPLFVRPDILAREKERDDELSRISGQEHQQGSGAELADCLLQPSDHLRATWPCYDRRLEHPLSAYIDEDPQAVERRHAWAERATHDFDALTPAEQGEVHRRAGAGLWPLISGLQGHRWDPQATVQDDLPEWVQLLFVRTLMARVSCMGDKSYVSTRSEEAIARLDFVDRMKLAGLLGQDPQVSLQARLDADLDADKGLGTDESPPS